MSHIDHMSAYLSKQRHGTPRVLLVFSSPFGSAVGDTVVAANHWKFLRRALGKVKLTVWSTDSQVWQVLCGPEVECTPFLSHDVICSDFDLIIFDWVQVDKVLEGLLSRSKAVLLDIPPSENNCKYKLSDTPWIRVDLPPMMNRPRRLHEVYSSLGVNTDPETSDYSGISSSSGGYVYLNPYASSGAKCLDRLLLEGILESLPRAIHPFTIICPAIPKDVHSSDVQDYKALHNAIASAASEGLLQLLPQMGKRDYIKTVLSARLAIGSDTSTQHVASVRNIPSIACYPNNAGYRYYFWGSPGSNNLCFHTPSNTQHDQIRSLADLVVFLAGGVLQPQSHTSSSSVESLGNLFLSTCKGIAEREWNADEGERRLAEVVSQIRHAVPLRWTSHIIPEIEQIADEMCSRSRSMPEITDTVGLARLQDVNAVKVINSLLATLASSEEKSVPSL